MKAIAILQSNYLPWRGYFDLIHDVDTFVFYDEVKYTKNDWRNRNRIYTKNGLQWLSIPISKKATNQKISQVEFEASSWQQAHYKTLYYSYRQAPYFYQLEPLLQRIYLDQEWQSLSQLNHYLIQHIARLLTIDTTFVNSSDLDLAGDRVERLVNIAQQLNAQVYLSGPSARGYLAGHEHKFADQGVSLRYKDYTGYPPYRQLAIPFEPAVSIIDLIANIELNSIPQYIWGWRNEPLHG